jgi:hypothetical protein
LTQVILYIHCHDLVVVWLINGHGVLDWTLTPLSILNYNSQWRSRQFTITVYSAIAISHIICLQLTTSTESSYSAIPH